MTDDKPDDDLGAHTPSPEYMIQSVKRRVLELLGAESGLVNALAPLPYKSKYPFSPKLLDAAITMQIDPIVKPLSLKGKLDKMPALKKLAGELADKGFFRKYPGGGVGIGGGGGSPGDEGGGGPGSGGAPGETGAGFGPGEPGGGGPGIGDGPAGPGGFAGNPGEDPTGMTADPGGMFGPGPSGPAGPTASEDPEGTRGTPTGPNLSAAARASSPTFGNLSSGFLGALGIGPNASASNLSAAVSTALSALGLLGMSGMPGAGLTAGTAFGTANAQISSFAATHGLSPATAAAALAAMAEESAKGVGGFTGGQGGGADQGEVTSIADVPFAATSPAGRPTISPATRANAAARAGGGISEDFLAALESLRGAA